MSTITDMIKEKIINIGDSVEFKFKGHYFVASIKEGVDSKLFSS